MHCRIGENPEILKDINIGNWFKLIKKETATKLQKRINPTNIPALKIVIIIVKIF